MANSVTTQVLEDGERNVVISVVGILDTADLTNTTLIDPALLSVYNGPVPNRVSIMDLEYSVEGTLSLRFLWKATADVVALTADGFGRLCYENVGGIPNNAGVGVTGVLALATEGWAALAVLHFSFKLKCKKYTV